MAEKTLSVKLSLNDRQFQSALRKSTRSIQRFGNKMQSFGDTMTRNITLPVIGLGAAAVKLASDFEETQSKFNTIFRDIREEANLTAKNLADNFGLSSRASMQLLSDTGSLLVGFGFTQEEALKLSNEVNKLAVDLASFSNFSGGAEGASRILTKALLGQREALNSLDIAITETDLRQFAEEQGLVFKELGRIEKANLTFQLALRQSNDAVGDFSRTSGSLANQLRELNGELETVAIELGVELLPIAKSLVSGLRDLTKFTSQFSDEQKKAALQVAGFAAALGPIISIGGRLVKAFAFLRKFFLGSFIPALKTLGRALVALTPQGKIIAGLILAAQFIFTHWNDIVTAFDNVKKSAEGLLERLGLLKKQEDIALDFSIQDQSGQVFDVDELRKRTAAFKGVKIIPEKKPIQMSPEEREGRAKMASDKALANQFKFVESIEATSVALKEVKNDFATLEPIVENFEESLSGFDIVGNELTNSFESFGNVLQGTFAQALQSSDGFFKTFVAGAKQAMSALLAQLAATAALNALLGGGKFGKALGFKDIGGVGGIGTLLKGLPFFSDGGMVTGATLAMVGEGPGTSISNPEVIAPLDKLKSMIGVNGGGAVQVFGTISGQDILLSSDRARNNRNRTRGY